ncbi:MAG: hypothetical protein ACRC5M_04790 [Anaeroplasmataceae bacterium]
MKNTIEKLMRTTFANDPIDVANKFATSFETAIRNYFGADLDDLKEDNRIRIKLVEECYKEKGTVDVLFSVYSYIINNAINTITFQIPRYESVASTHEHVGLEFDERLENAMAKYNYEIVSFMRSGLLFNGVGENCNYSMRLKYEIGQPLERRVTPSN